ncbi:MAG: acyltransferase [Actinomycetota bacterium]|nr:acyltransferase [Actinomycetota bacterium]
MTAEGVKNEGEELTEVELEASEVLPPPPGHPRFPLLDSIRAFAAISVMLVHVSIFTGGFDSWYRQFFGQLDIGVPIFFLLSGFLLYRPMLGARIAGLPKQKISAYARNRFVRIMPAFWVVLTVAAIYPGFHGAFTGDWWVYYGLLQNYPVYTPDVACATDPIRCGFPPAWSLTVEVFFYLTLPLWAFAMARIGRLFTARRWVAVELGGLALLAAVSLYFQSYVPITDLETWLFFSPLGRGWWFALGMSLAVFSVWVQVRPDEPAAVRYIRRHPSVWWILGAGLYLFVTYVILDPGPSLAFPVIEPSKYLVSVVAFGIIPFLLLLPAIFGSEGDGLVRRMLRNPVLVWLGLISYGIFLWHIPVMIVLLDAGVAGWFPSAQFPVMVIATFAVTVVFAALSFYLVERPLMLWSRRRSQTVNRGQ